MDCFRELTLEDKPEFLAFTRGKDIENSEMSFANYYIWGGGWRFETKRLHDALFIRGRNPESGQWCYYQPLVARGGDVAGAIDAVFADLHALNAPARIIGVNAEFAEAAKALNYTLTEDRDMFEYVYNAQALIALSGKKYHAKRNHINRFVQENPHSSTRIMTAGDLPAALELFDRWAAEHPSGEYILAERDAISRGLTHLSALNLTGFAVETSGHLAAFSIAERVSPAMVNVHIEKADTRCYTGIFSYICREFLERCFSDVTYVNRQEDMGLPGLRKAKESYYPERLIPKYIVEERP